MDCAPGASFDLAFSLALTASTAMLELFPAMSDCAGISVVVVCLMGMDWQRDDAILYASIQLLWFLLIAALAWGWPWTLRCHFYCCLLRVDSWCICFGGWSGIGLGWGYCHLYMHHFNCPDLYWLQVLLGDGHSHYVVISIVTCDECLHRGIFCGSWFDGIWLG